MQKGINYATQDLKEKVVQTINESGVPVVLVRYVLADLLEQASRLEQTQTQREKAEYENAQKQDSEQEQEVSE